MKERIILSLELVDDENRDAYCSMRVPYDERNVIFGPWLDNAIADMRSECRDLLKRRASEQKP